MVIFLENLSVAVIMNAIVRNKHFSNLKRQYSFCIIDLIMVVKGYRCESGNLILKFTENFNYFPGLATLFISFYTLLVTTS